jgi:hypothetical protein
MGVWVIDIYLMWLIVLMVVLYSSDLIWSYEDIFKYQAKNELYFGL